MSHFRFIILIAFLFTTTNAGERLLIQLKDFTQTEVKSGGFSLPSNMTLHIYALGGGEKKAPFSNTGMYAYGWIINADTREVVWKMDRNNTTRQDNYRKYDDDVSLNKGSYEVYFAAYGFASSSIFSSFIMNIDRRHEYKEDDSRKKGFLSWLEEAFGKDARKNWKRLSKNWEISLYVDDRSPDIYMFNTPKEFPNTLFKSTQLGEDEHIRQRFTITKSIPIRIYALGEKNYGEGLSDYGWMINVRTHQRIWDMAKGNQHHAGGADKNIKFDKVITFPAGDYILHYYTDDSHSFEDWNAPPPNDPFNFGVTLSVSDEKLKSEFKLTPMEKEEQNIIVQLVKIENDETKSASFTLKEESPLRIYALGERNYSRREMADFGWIINSKTREKVWKMEAERTEHAGGGDKNRMIDEIILLPKGTYTAFYQTDDSHGYEDWNTSPPFDPEHWGITVYGAGDNFNMAIVERNVAPHETGVIAQIIRVGDNADRIQQFKLDKTTRIRIYALGEGQNREMYDYGWIENADTKNVVWEMTHSMTFHAGGGRKNRSVSTTIVLDKGNYTLYYISDDSHSYNRWNTDPPDDPMMWGITLYYEDK
ncbi:MAG: hypothetical protein HY800_00115 [Ignavibacteriales bacterium]|nr:hypothetical protein [Ignavibacteriales bacterium]